MAHAHHFPGTLATEAPPRHDRRLALVLALTLAYMVAEVAGGLLANSLALLADAGHMLSDAGALALALFAIRMARRPPSATHTFGYQRAEILAALANGAALVAIAAYVVIEAVRRVGSPPDVAGGLMSAVAAGGLAVNLTALWLLRRGRRDSLNLRGAWLHVFADALGSIGAITAGLAIVFFGWTWADPAVSLLIAGLVVYSAWSLLEETVAILMQAAPRRLDVARLEEQLQSVDGVTDVHDLHVWTLSHARDVLSAHLTVDRDADRAAVMAEVNRRLRDDFDLHHSTIQLECPAECAPCRPVTQSASGGEGPARRGA